jgi:hypothetical protein
MESFVLTDVLVLGIGRTRRGWSLAGMTTERDSVTVLRWVRPIKRDVPLTIDDLRYGDGSLIRLGDVVRLDLQEPQSQPPHIENVITNWDAHPPTRVRSLNAERYQNFFPKHLDPAPADVLVRRQRSLCLVRPDTLEAVFARDPETERFEARLIITIGRLHNEDGLPVADPFWRALGEQQLGDEEYLEWDQHTLQTMYGKIYLVCGLGPRGGPMVLGVHSVPPYQLDLDDTTL